MKKFFLGAAIFLAALKFGGSIATASEAVGRAILGF